MGEYLSISNISGVQIQVDEDVFSVILSVARDIGVGGLFFVSVIPDGVPF